MIVKNTLIERGKLGKDRQILETSGLIIPERKIPVTLQNNPEDEIGVAEVHIDEFGYVIANLDIKSDKRLLKLFPAIVVKIKGCHSKGSIKVVNKSEIFAITLHTDQNCDPKIPTIGKKMIE